MDREIERLHEEEISPPVIMAILAAGYEWWIWLAKMPPQPVGFSLLALFVIGYAVYKIVTLRGRIHSLKLGLEGEKSVGEELERLRSQGCNEPVILKPENAALVSSRLAIHVRNCA